jgi:tetratricopeptide (TPR) repeat protein
VDAIMVESPAHLQAEIEKYERKYAEDPEGRGFVPLANAYRKVGRLARAEELLRDGLSRYPDYLSAHIVLGRVLADQGAAEEAATEFRHVLAIDPQNLIALRTMAELASSGGRPDEAGYWYRELLAVDPMNEEARDALSDIEEAMPAEESFDARAAWWEQEKEPEPEEPVTAGVPEGEVAEPAAPAAIEPGMEDAAEAVEIIDAEFELEGEGPEHAEAQPAAELEATEADRGLHDIVIDWEPAEEAVSLQPPTVVDLPTADGSGEAEGGADELVSETLAELYASQGFRDEAADMYRRLIRRRGAEPALVARLEELEAAEPIDEPDSAAPAAPPPWLDDAPAAEPDAATDTAAEADSERVTDWEAPAPSSAIADSADSFADSFHAGFEGEAAAAPVEQPAEHEETHVPTIGAFFASLLAWKPEAETGAQRAEPPAAPGESPVAAAPAVEDDELFPWELPDPLLEPSEAQESAQPDGAGATDLVGTASPGVADPPPEEPVRRAEKEEAAGPWGTAADDYDDLESFQAWLRSLKR